MLFSAGGARRNDVEWSFNAREMSHSQLPAKSYNPLCSGDTRPVWVNLAISFIAFMQLILAVCGHLRFGGSLQVLAELVLKGSLGLHNEFTDIACRGTSAAVGGDPVAVLFDQGVGVLHGDGQTGP